MKLRSCKGRIGKALPIAAVGVLVVLCGASSHARAALGPVAFVLDATGDDETLRTSLMTNLAQELKRPIVAAIDIKESADESLTVIIRGEQAKLLHTRPHESRERVTVLPRLREERVRRLVWLAGNLCRNQLGELSLSEGGEGAKEEKADVAPVEPVADVAPAPMKSPSTEPPALAVTSRALPETPPQPGPKQDWLLRASAGPGVTPYDYIFGYNPLVSDLYTGTSVQLDVEYMTQDTGNWMGSVMRGGSRAFLAGGALSRVWVWRLRRSELKLFGGAGICATFVSEETLETTNSTKTGVNSEKTVTIKRGGDAFALVGAIWSFPLWQVTQAHLKLTAFVPNAEPKWGTFVTLSTGFAWNL